MTFFNGEKYEGEFKDGEYDGQGTFTFPDGDKYEGEWKDGNREGHATMIFADGRKYVGEYKDDSRHGKATQTMKDGTKFEGEYKKGEKWNGKECGPDGSYIYQEGKYISAVEFQNTEFLSDNNLTILPNGKMRDENYEEYELEEESVDFIVYKPEGMRGMRAYIKTDSEKNYLAWSGPIKTADKSKFLRGDLEKTKEEAPVQEQEVGNIEAEVELEQEIESETTDSNMSLSERLNKLTKLYDEGILTEEEYQKKSAELMS